MEFPADGELATFTRCKVCTCTSGVFVCTEHPAAECSLESCKEGDACTDATLACRSGLGCDVTICMCGSDGKLGCLSTAC